MDRRGFVSAAVALLGASTLPAWLALPGGAADRHPAGPAASLPSTEGALGPVVGYHLDRPYLDLSGTAQAYRAPAGARSGEGLAAASAADFIGQFGYC
ncbi:MAG TPA: hypothetical protein VME21_18760 [Steroidobacteraceae bacterium]|nr:hypothetical protein [Steroidobacteraceae bacterium]